MSTVHLFCTDSKSHKQNDSCWEGKIPHPYLYKVNRSYPNVENYWACSPTTIPKEQPKPPYGIMLILVHNSKQTCVFTSPHWHPQVCSWQWWCFIAQHISVICSGMAYYHTLFALEESLLSPAGHATCEFGIIPDLLWQVRNCLLARPTQSPPFPFSPSLYHAFSLHFQTYPLFFTSFFLFFSRFVFSLENLMLSLFFRNIPREFIKAEQKHDSVEDITWRWVSVVEYPAKPLLVNTDTL